MARGVKAMLCATLENTTDIVENRRYWLLWQMIHDFDKKPENEMLFLILKN